MVTDSQSRVLRMKLALIGISRSGKGQILQDWASQQGDGQVQRSMVGDSSLLQSFFRWSDLPKEGWTIDLQAFTTEGEVSHSAVNELILSDVDGITFVVPVDGSRVGEIRASLAELGEVLARHRRHLSELPMVLHYHQAERLPEVDPNSMNDYLGIPRGAIPHVLTRSDDGSALTASMAILLQELMKSAHAVLPAEEEPV